LKLNHELVDGVCVRSVGQYVQLVGWNINSGTLHRHQVLFRCHRELPHSAPGIFPNLRVDSRAGVGTVSHYHHM